MYLQKYINKTTLLIVIILSLSILDITLFKKIRQQNNVKGVQYISEIKDEIIFKSDDNYKYFYEPKPNTIIKDKPVWLGYEIAYHHNSDGLHEQQNYSIEKDQNVFRILTMGDSFTYGLIVNTWQNWTEILEKSLNQTLICKNKNKIEILNLGVNGYDLEYSSRRLFQTGLKYNPDLVIWLVNNWNFDKINEKFIPIRQDLEKVGVPLFDIKEGRYLSGKKARQVLKNKFGDEYILDYQEKVLRYFMDNYKGDLFIFSLSSIEQRYKDLINKTFRSHPNFDFKEIPALNRNDLLPDGHPNKVGHSKISQEIFIILLSQYFKNC